MAHRDQLAGEAAVLPPQLLGGAAGDELAVTGRRRDPAEDVGAELPDLTPFPGRGPGRVVDLGTPDEAGPGGVPSGAFLFLPRFADVRKCGIISVWPDDQPKIQPTNSERNWCDYPPAR